MSNRLPPFTPHPLVRNPHVQTLLGSRLGPPHRSDLEARSQEMVLSLDVDGGVRLQGFYTPRPQNAANGKGLALLLHGWLGSVQSTYMLAVGDDLRRRGYALFRLNMRDHGDTVALNEDMFHGCRLEEVFQAARQVAALEPGSPFYIAGFSMGGNFALRLAWQHSLRPIPTLQGVVAVSPSIRPGKTLAAIDRSLPLYRHYFLLKWRRKLEQKQTAFPHRYDFSDLLTLKSSCAISERVIPRYTGFADTASYYARYAVTPGRLKAVNVPTTIITAQDDPIIPFADFAPLTEINPCVTLSVQPYGGHMGFVDLFPLRRWLTGAVAACLNQT